MDESYEADGNFKEDFKRICEEKGFSFIPAIVARPPPQSLFLSTPKADKQVKKTVRPRVKPGLKGTPQQLTSQQATLPQLEQPGEHRVVASQRWNQLLKFAQNLTSQSEQSSQEKVGGERKTSLPLVQVFSPPSSAPNLNGAVASRDRVLQDKENSLESLPPGARDKDADAIDETVCEEEEGSVEEELILAEGRSRKDYFMPCIQVMQQEDDYSVTEVYVRGWRVDMAMMSVFQQCWPLLSLLHTVHLWNTGLDADTLPLLASFLPLCTALRTLVLDNNPLAGTCVSGLIGEGSVLHHLSLRFCGLTKIEAYGLGNKLPSSGLLTLGLSNNKLGDEGVAHIAKALKINRTLVTLNLAANDVSDDGAEMLAEALSHFCLTHEQEVERRKLMAKKEAEQKEAVSFFDSVTALLQGRKLKGPGAAHVAKPLATDKLDLKRQKDSKERARSKSYSIKSSKQPRPLEKQDAQKKEALDRSKTSKLAEKLRSPRAVRIDRKATKFSVHRQEVEANPLTDVGCFVGNTFFMVGNRTLASLNLSRNRIGERGVAALTAAVEDQMRPVHYGLQKTWGLQRLVVHRNKVPASSANAHRLAHYMRIRNPFFKSPYLNLNKPGTVPCSIPVMR